MDKNPSLQQIIEEDSKLEHIVIDIKDGIPINISNMDVSKIRKDMQEIVEKYALDEHYRGCGHSFGYEGWEPKGKIFHKYWVKFDNELSANRFMILINKDPSIPYSASVPKEYEPVGFANLKVIKKLE